MFNNKRIKALEQRAQDQKVLIDELRSKVSRLESACTMRVGERTRSLAYYFGVGGSDSRPIATAIELIQQLMERQKLTVEAVPVSPATFTVTKS